MRINCAHGYFRFYAESAGGITRFNDAFELELEACDDYYTFPELAELDTHSIFTSPYADVPAIKTYAGRPWEIMRQNRLVYDLSLGKVSPLLSFTQFTDIAQVGLYYTSGGLIQPGSRFRGAEQIVSYNAWFNFDAMRFKYSDIEFRGPGD